MRRAVDIGIGALVIGLTASALVPLLDRALARHHAARELRAVQARPRGASGQTRALARGAQLPLLALAGKAPLASWGSIGGCGAGGSSASSPGGGIMWVGRNVTGGVVDVQALTTGTWADGSRVAALATRIAISPTQRFGLALNVPILHKAGDVTVLGATREARIAGFGDVSLEASYKLGAILSHRVALIASAPTGAWDAVRQGVVLPVHLQLGSGVPALACQYQQTRDFDWGLMLLGGTASYAGWENSRGDHRAPSATAYAHAGYLLGPWVPSAGLTIFGKPTHDREGHADRPSSRDPLVMLVPSLGLEWANDWVAILPAATLGLSPGGVESVSFGLGLSSSLF